MARHKTDYSEKIDKILEIISETSKGAKRACEEVGMNYRTFMSRLSESEELQHRYARAKELQIELFADEIIEIADDSSGDKAVNHLGNVVENKEFVNRSRLRMDARKWLMAKLMPKKYGDKLDITTDGKEIKQLPSWIENDKS